MKIVHAADLHLDSPLRAVRPPAPLQQIRLATRHALANLVDLCIAEHAALLLLAGDLYDGDWRDYSTGLYFAHQMGRLREAGVQVVMIRGNHDAASQITKSLHLPDNVRELSPRRPESVYFESLGVVVHGQSFANRAVTENLAEHYPAREPSLLNIGLLHTSITGRTGHEPYAPCTLDDLRSMGYDYWALGHVHTREIVHREPWVVFPGNLQGRHARETGEKGAMLIEYEAAGIASVEPRALDVVRYAQCALDLSGVRNFDEGLDRLRPVLERELERADGRVLGVRVELVGHTPLHARLLANDDFLGNVQALAQDVSSDELWIEKLQVHTSSEAQAHAAGVDQDALSELLSAIAAQRDDPALLAELSAGLEELRSKLPAEVREGAEGLHVDEPGFLALQLNAALQLLEARLSESPLPSETSRT